MNFDTQENKALVWQLFIDEKFNEEYDDNKIFGARALSRAPIE